MLVRTAVPTSAPRQHIRRFCHTRTPFSPREEFAHSCIFVRVICTILSVVCNQNVFDRWPRCVSCACLLKPTLPSVGPSTARRSPPSSPRAAAEHHGPESSYQCMHASALRSFIESHGIACDTCGNLLLRRFNLPAPHKHEAVSWWMPWCGHAGVDRPMRCTSPRRAVWTRPLQQLCESTGVCDLLASATRTKTIRVTARSAHRHRSAFPDSTCNRRQRIVLCSVIRFKCFKRN